MSPTTVSTHWCTITCVVGTLRAIARSQSFATPYTSELALVVVSDTVGAPVAAFAVTDAPTPLAPRNDTTVSDCGYPAKAGVEVTVAFVRTLVAVARQISEDPCCALTRFTSVQARPAPDTVRV